MTPRQPTSDRAVMPITTPPRPQPRSQRRLHPLTVALVLAALAGGVATGGSEYLNRSHAPAPHQDGTAAWWPHAALSAFAAAWITAAYLHRRHRACAGRPTGTTPLALAPLGTRAAHRLGRTWRQAPGRAIATIPFLAMLAYSTWRVGEQVLAGLDPHFTADAWGGPSYLGAMYCHCLDSGLITATAALIVHRLLINPQPAATDSHPQ